MHAVILAAGKGTRLLPLTKKTPKPLIEVHGTPLLIRALEALPSRVDSVTIVIGHLGDQIRAYVGDCWEHLSVRYVVQKQLTGTGDAIGLLKDQIAEPTIVINADDLYKKRDLERLSRHALAMLAIKTRNALQFPLDVSWIGRCRGFLPPNKSGRFAWQNCGAYMIDERYFSIDSVRIPVRGGEESSLPHTLLALSGAHPIRRVRASSWVPVGTHEELERAEATFS